MTRRMDQKVAIITGSASGIGRATAILFAQEGASVVVADVNDDGGAETVRQIADAKGTAIFLHTDVTKPEQVDRLIKQTVSRYGRLDALVNNAFFTVFNRPVGETSDDCGGPSVGSRLSEQLGEHRAAVPEHVPIGATTIFPRVSPIRRGQHDRHGGTRHVPLAAHGLHHHSAVVSRS